MSWHRYDGSWDDQIEDEERHELDLDGKARWRLSPDPYRSSCSAPTSPWVLLLILVGLAYLLVTA